MDMIIGYDADLRPVNTMAMTITISMTKRDQRKKGKRKRCWLTKETRSQGFIKVWKMAKSNPKFDQRCA